MLKFNHGHQDIKAACGLTDEDIKNFFSEIEKANEEAESLSQFVEKIENIVLSNQVYLRCAMFHMVMREADIMRAIENIIIEAYMSNNKKNKEKYYVNIRR